MAFGLAKTSAFMLNTASVLIGSQANLFNLTPTANSIGLVKNFKISAEPSYTELTQGVKNTIVFSVLTKNAVRASMEVYEHTAKTLAYGLGLDGSTGYSVAAATTTSGAVSPAATTIPVTSATGIAANDYIIINYGSDDNTLVRRVTTVAALNLTVAATPAGLTIPSGSLVQKIATVGIGSKVEQPFLSAMIIGGLADGTQGLIAIPKMRITKGFDLDFRTDNYGNMPFEFTIYDQVAADPFYAEFAGDQARAFWAV